MTPHGDRDFSTRDLVAGALVGVRSFRVLPDGHLSGVVYPAEWGPGDNKAVCGRPAMWLEDPPSKHHPPASLDCTCGFYAYFDAGHNPHHKSGHVIGLIRGWGLASVGDRGFRCETARIIALVDTGGLERSWPEVFADQLASLARTFADLAYVVSGKPAPKPRPPVPVPPPVSAYASRVPPEVRKRYPRVPVFPSLGGAVARFPLTPVETPSRGAA